MPDIEREVRKLARTIYRLLALSDTGWVTWDRVAKWQTGSTLAAPVLSGYATLREWKHLFFATDIKVKLSPEGIQFVEALPPEEATAPECVAAAVVQYAQGLQSRFLKIEEVSTVASANNRVVQAVRVELEDDLVPTETPVKIWITGGRPTQGKIVGQEPDGGILYVALDSRILPADLPARLEIERSYLLTKLADQIRSLEEFPERMRSMFCRRAGSSLIADDDSILVAERLADLPTPWTRFLWGPPGAGKTYGLGHFVARLLRAEPQSTVLIVAPSNRAVDVAIDHLRIRLTVASMENLLSERKVLRYGYPRKSAIIEVPELLGPIHLDGLNGRAREVSRQIAKAEQDSVSDADLAVLRANLLAEQEAVKQAVEQHIRQCSVVGTTTTLAYMPNSPVGKQEWDTVIIDEVTMVPPAVCAYLASRAKRRLLLAGDPRQLGPVYEEHGPPNENTYFWLGRDVFEMCGLSSGAMEDRHVATDDARLTRITTQRRCASGIWNRVSHLYPEVNNGAAPNKLKNLASLPPCPGESVVLLDTSDSVARCQHVKGSWQNRFTAELAMEVATTIAAEASGSISIAIISPYRAQVRLFRRWIREERKADTTPLKTVELEAGTIHQFQGSEADVVIFDMVDGVGRDVIGKLLRDDTGIRLVNVAVTRAKGKLILIADKNWCAGAQLDRNNGLLDQLILGHLPIKRVPVLPPAELPRNVRSDGRVTESPIEEALLDAVLQHPALATVETQYEIQDRAGKLVTRADFAFPDIKYAVYCDGRQWHLQQDRWQRDLRQRNELTALGWAFSVFTGREINKDARGCATQVLTTYMARLESLMQA